MQTPCQISKIHGSREPKTRNLLCANDLGNSLAWRSMICFKVPQEKKLQNHCIELKNLRVREFLLAFVDLRLQIIDGQIESLVVELRWYLTVLQIKFGGKRSILLLSE